MKRKHAKITDVVLVVVDKAGIVVAGKVGVVEVNDVDVIDNGVHVCSSVMPRHAFPGSIQETARSPGVHERSMCDAQAPLFSTKVTASGSDTTNSRHVFFVKNCSTALQDGNAVQTSRHSV